IHRPPPKAAVNPSINPWTDPPPPWRFPHPGVSLSPVVGVHLPKGGHCCDQDHSLGGTSLSEPLRAVQTIRPVQPPRGSRFEPSTSLSGPFPAPSGPSCRLIDLWTRTGPGGP